MLSDVTAEVSAALQDSWWNRIRELSPLKTGDSGSTPAAVFQMAEDYLTGRVASLLAHILPQMQNLIITSVAGLLLLLLAVSSYPFQPHDLLLLFNWTGILAFVCIAMWVFVEMNRDPVLSDLNGTKPGKIDWNKLTYDVDLRAQASLGETVRLLAPGENASGDATFSGKVSGADVR
jgi:hypothetical protein